MNLTYLMRELQMAKEIFKDQKGVHMTIKGSSNSSRKKKKKKLWKHLAKDKV